MNGFPALMVMAWLAAPVVIGLIVTVYYLVDERLSSPRYRRAVRRNHARCR
jgi:hypothetical protein